MQMRFVRIVSWLTSKGRSCLVTKTVKLLDHRWLCEFRGCQWDRHIFCFSMIFETGLSKRIGK